MRTFERRNRYYGAVVECQVGVPPMLARHMHAMGQAVLGPFDAHAMIDTGAATSVIEPMVVAALQIEPVDRREATPLGSAPRVENYYDVLFLLPDGIELRTQAVEMSIGLEGVQCILGRDLLNMGVFVYDGIRGVSRFEMP